MYYESIKLHLECLFSEQRWPVYWPHSHGYVRNWWKSQGQGQVNNKLAMDTRLFQQIKNNWTNNKQQSNASCGSKWITLNESKKELYGLDFMLCQISHIMARNLRFNNF